MTTASATAHFIVRFFQQAGEPVTNLKLQKLLYYVQGWHLGIYKGTPAFDDDLEAWVHGPVVPSIYRQYRNYKWNPITQPVGLIALSGELKRHISDVLEVYGTDQAFDLERRTHSEAPWKMARRGIPNDQDSHAIITKKSMADYFGQLVRAP